MEEQPDGKDAASEGQKHLPRGQSLLMNGRFAFWAALRLGSHGPSPGPRLRAAGPPPSCAGGLARLPGACPACGPLPGASPVGAPARSPSLRRPRGSAPHSRCSPRRLRAGGGPGPLDGAALRCRLLTVPLKFDTRPLTRPGILAILDMHTVPAMQVARTATSVPALVVFSHHKEDASLSQNRVLQVKLYQAGSRMSNPGPCFSSPR